MPFGTLVDPFPERRNARIEPQPLYDFSKNQIYCMLLCLEIREAVLPNPFQKTNHLVFVKFFAVSFGKIEAGRV